MALYIPHSVFHLARLLYVRPEAFEPYYINVSVIFHFTVMNILLPRIYMTRSSETRNGSTVGVSRDRLYRKQFVEMSVGDVFPYNMFLPRKK